MKKAARGVGVPDPQATAKGPKQGKYPTHTPTKKSRKKVRMLSSLGFTQEEIALMLELGETALKRHYPRELTVGALEADAKVLGNLYRLATQTKDLNIASRNSIFWAKVRRRWHEVQRVIHGYDPDTIKAFVKSVVMMLRRELPDKCPGCHTKLDLGPKIAAELVQLSNAMAAKLPPSEIVAVPRPDLAADHADE